MKKLKVLANSSFIGDTGYNSHTREFFTALSKFSDLKVRNYTIGKSWNGYNKTPHNKESYIKQEHKDILFSQTLYDDGKRKDYPIYSHDSNFKPDVNIVLNEVNHHYFYDDYEGPKIAYNVWESTKYPDDFMDRILEYDQLWVPTEWQKQCSIKQGYPSDRVKVIPEAVDATTFFPEEIKYDDNIFRFLVFGRWDYRKSINEIIESFLKTFNKNEKVELVLSVDNPFSIDGMKTTEERLKHYGFNDKRIKVIHFPSREKYIEYLKSGHVFVSCARSEGWNLPLIEALACGTPSIYSNWGAQLEFAKGKGHPVEIIGERPASDGSEFSYGAGAKSVDGKHGYKATDLIPGNYCEPDYDDLSKTMRYIYENYDKCKKKALDDSKLIREQFTWENAAKKAYKILENIDIPDGNKYTYNIYYNKNDHKLYFENNKGDIGHRHVYIKDVSNNITMYHFDWDLSTNMRAIPSNIVSDYNLLKNFKGFLVQVLDEEEKIIYETNVIVNDCDKIDDLKFHQNDKEELWINIYEMFYKDIYQNMFEGDINTVIDIGANIGIFTRYCLKKGVKKCYSIEPSIAYKYLEKNFKGDNRIKCIDAAITGKSGVANLYIQDNGESLSSLFLDESKKMNEKYITKQVKTYSFNDFVTKYNIDKIDILKIDVEGSEYEILEHMSDDYLKNNISKSIIEFHFNDGIKLKRIIDKLERNGFAIQIKNQSTTETGSIDNTNGILFASKNAITKKHSEKFEFRYEENKDNILVYVIPHGIEYGKEYNAYIRDGITDLLIYSDEFSFKDGVEYWMSIDNMSLGKIRFVILDSNKNIVFEKFFNTKRQKESIIDHHIYSQFIDEIFGIYRGIMHNKEYEYDICRVEKGDICVDIGANIGLFSMYGSLLGASKIYAIEPCSFTFDHLIRNKSINEKYDNVIIPFKCAITADTGKRDMFVYGVGSCMNSLVDVGLKLSHEKESVNAVNINDFVYSNKIDHINFLKIDAEGSEYEIIDTIDSEFLSKHIDKMVIEFHEVHNNDYETSLDKIIKCGFEYYENKDNDPFIMLYAWKPHLKKEIKSAFVVTWFGELPYWFSYFLKSCEYNPLYDWLIFSDALPPNNIPSNVKFIKFDLQEFNKLASDKLNRNVEITNAYKLCDFKSLYGFIYEEYLTKYDYWGFCDIDVIWGDINKFFGNYLRKGIDIITLGAEEKNGLHYRICGPCTLVKNIEELNKLFFNVPELEEIFSSNNYINFEESHWDKYVKNNDNINLEILLNLQSWENGGPILDNEWNNGKLYLPSGREIMMSHMIEKNRTFEDTGFRFFDSNKQDDELVYITGGDEKYMPLIDVLTRSLLKYSKYKIIVYGYNCDVPIKYENVIKKRIDIKEDNLIDYSDRPVGYMFAKQQCCLDAIQNFNYKNFVWIDGDSFASKHIDNVTKYISQLDNYPLINSHIHDSIVSNITGRTMQEDLIELVGAANRQYPWLHACMMLFNKSSDWFFREVLMVAEKLHDDIKLRQTIFGTDELLMNVLLWKYGFDKKMDVHDLDSENEDNFYKFSLNDVEKTYKNFTPLLSDGLSPHAILPTKEEDILVYHGQKDAKKANEMVDYLDKKIHYSSMGELQLEQQSNEIGLYFKYFDVNDGDVVVDLGACLGLTTLEILKRNPKKVYCVEASDLIYKDLYRNITNFSNVIPCKLLIGEEKNKIGIFEYSDKDNDVEILSFYEFVKQNNIDKIDFLKMDIEGAEFEIFNDKNSRDWIGNNVKNIVGENHIDHKKEEFFDLINKIKDLGFDLILNSIDGIDITQQVINNQFLSDVNEYAIDYYRHVLFYAFKDRFCWVTAGDEKYMGMIDVLAKSLLKYSKHKLIVYGFNCDPNIDLPNVINRRIDFPVKTSNFIKNAPKSDLRDKEHLIYFAKYLASLESLNENYDTFAMIDGDVFVTENIDKCVKYSNDLLDYPLFMRYYYGDLVFWRIIDGVKMECGYGSELSKIKNINRNPNNRIVAGGFYFYNKKSENFFNSCLDWNKELDKISFTDYIDDNSFADERVVNNILWKDNLDKYLPVTWNHHNGSAGDIQVSNKYTKYLKRGFDVMFDENTKDVYFIHGPDPSVASKNAKILMENYEDYYNNNMLMIVAHPDDEIIFGGAELIQNASNYQVICVTCGEHDSSKHDFEKVMNELGVCSYEIWDYKAEFELFENKLVDDISKIINSKKWDKIVTHNPIGEYGHIQHKQIFDIVKELTDDFYIFTKTPEILSSDVLDKKKNILDLYESEQPIIHQLRVKNGDWYISPDSSTNYIEYGTIEKYDSSKDITSFISCMDKSHNYQETYNISRAYDIGMIQSNGEITSLVEFLKDKNIKNFLEIGTDQGGTFYLFTKITSGKKISLDLPRNSFETESILEARNNLMRSWSDNVHIISGDSHKMESLNQVKKILDGELLDLLFIDGDHTYNGVYQDYIMYSSLVQDDGYIVFHDTNDSEEYTQSGYSVSILWNQLDGNKIEFNENNSWGGIGLITKNSSNTINNKIDTTGEELTINVNFVQGAMAELLSNKSSEYYIEFIDSDKGQTIHQEYIKNNTWIKPDRKWYTNWLIRIINRSSNKIIHEHKFDLTNKRAYIALESKSLGDTLAWMPYVEEFRKKHNCETICSTFWNHFFKSEYKDITFVKPGTTVHNLYAMYSVGIFSEDGMNPIDIKKTPLQKVATDILGLDYEEIKPKIHKKPKLRKIKEPYICIAPYATAQCKFWNNQNGWQELVDHLNKKGYKVVLISREESGYMGNDHPTGIIDKSGDKYDIYDRINDLEHADAFIGVGSGLSWLAWAVGTPVIMISGFSPPWYEFKCERIINMDVCNSCWPENKLDAGNWNWCPKQKNFECTRSITSAEVIKSLNRILKN